MIPATGGLFQVELVRHCPANAITILTKQTYLPPTSTNSTDSDKVQAEKVLLWDRKTEGGFPETKVLKQRVRDRIDPKKDLGHSDVGGKKKDAVKSDAEEKKGDVMDVKVEGKEERIAEDLVADLEIEDAPDAGVKKNADGTVCEDCR